MSYTRLPHKLHKKSLCALRCNNLLCLYRNIENVSCFGNLNVILSENWSKQFIDELKKYLEMEWVLESLSSRWSAGRLAGRRPLYLRPLRLQSILSLKWENVELQMAFSFYRIYFWKWMSLFNFIAISAVISVWSWNCSCSTILLFNLTILPRRLLRRIRILL